MILDTVLVMDMRTMLKEVNLKSRQWRNDLNEDHNKGKNVKIHPDDNRSD